MTSASLRLLDKLKAQSRVACSDLLDGIASGPPEPLSTKPNGYPITVGIVRVKVNMLNEPLPGKLVVITNGHRDRIACQNLVWPDCTPIV